MITATAAVAGTQIPSALRAVGETAASVPKTPPEVELHWLEGGVPAFSIGSTWGVPWPRGTVQPLQSFAMRTDRGEAVPVQSWPLAYWPDGSLKWTGHAVAGNTHFERFLLAPGAPSIPVCAVGMRETADAIEIDTGVIQCRIAKRGATILDSIRRDGREILRAGRLVALRQDQPDLDADGALRQDSFTSAVADAVIEQRGPVRAVVKLTGRHRLNNGDREWLPFTLRLFFHAGGDAVRVMHSFVFDGDAEKDFLRGLGLRFSVPMSDPLHDRHIRFCGEGRGLWAEGVRNLTGLRRDPGAEVIDAQLAGKACPPLDRFPERVRSRLQYIPAWGDYSLTHLSPDSFAIRKRTEPGHAWISAAHGGRAPGVGYIGGASGGGVAFGLRDFWQRFPTQLDVRGATGEAAEVTLWMWSPDAPAMDLRFYHDGLGMDTHDKQLNGGLEITYEDFEPGFGTCSGVARTSELTLWALSSTPARESLLAMADAVRLPPQLACRPAHIHSTGVFGGAIWNLPDRSTPAKQRIEEMLDSHVGYYLQQVGQRCWYGFWNYGDVMHTYDSARHVWRYDVGGYGWDNSELSTDLWLWYAYLRSGRADIFRMAEAMTRHTGEVDVYHSGRFAGLGTRHGVQHWGDSAKQLRISTAIYRRPYYYLTADERVGDLLREVVHADAKLAEFNPRRKLSNQPGDPHQATIGVGTDWGSAASNWLTEWERTNDPQPRAWLENAMKVIGGNPLGFFAGGFGYEPAAKKLVPLKDAKISVSHLSAVFGLVEVCAELIQLLDVPEFDRAWLQYCTLYNASSEEQAAALGEKLTGTNLIGAHSRLTAYAAWRKNDPKLAARAWREFLEGDAWNREHRGPEKPVRIEGPAVLKPVDEIATLNTNDAAQRGLAAIQNLSLIGEQCPTVI